MTFTSGTPGTGTFTTNAISGYDDATTITISQLSSGTICSSVININNSTPLPIELLSFTGRPLDNTIELLWRTAAELNNDYMAVERSPDGLAFDEIGRVAGRGTTYEPQSYAFVDRSPAPGVNYYRLRQVDFDGTTEYHPVISVIFKGTVAEGSSLRLYPNPVREELRVEAPPLPPQRGGEGAAEAVVRILDGSGRVVARYVFPGGGGVYNLPVDQLPTGVYVVQWTQGGRVQAQKFVKE